MVPTEEKITQYSMSEAITKANLLEFVQKFQSGALKPLDDQKKPQKTQGTKYSQPKSGLVKVSHKTRSEVTKLYNK